MVSFVTAALVLLPLYWIVSNIHGLLKNIAGAKRSGLPYVITPINLYSPIWLLGYKIWIPIVRKLPHSWTDSWIDFMAPDFIWEDLRTPWARKGDIFLTVSPGLINIWVANAEAIHQITTRRLEFPKPLGSYKILEIFGRNIITTEGAEWKQHRKVSSPSFNEKNNALVFVEACGQAQSMLTKWTGVDGEGNITIKEVPTDTDRLTLHIISSIGFGKRLLWPGEKLKGDERSREVYSSEVPAEGHTMSFENALNTLLDRLILVLIIPKWLLKHLPFKATKEASESFCNWSQYMNELFIEKVEEAQEGQLQKARGMDLMGSLVKTAYSNAPKVRSSTSTVSEKRQASKAPVLSDSDILSNAFVMILAGHETTANSIHFSLIELAINGSAQRRVQKEVQTIFGDSLPETWNYDSNINKLLGGYLGAVLNEQLRLMPPVIAIPKSVPKGQDQIISLDGKNVALPAGAQIALCSVGVHRNPKYWPTQASAVNDKPDDLDDFKPERWLIKVVNGDKDHEEIDIESENDEYGGFTGKNTHAELFRPARGSYIPFSDGARSCLGRRLAQVKIMAVLAVIFQQYSIELAVDEWATDEEVARMRTEERMQLYKKAQEKARATLRGASTIITLRLHSDSVPIRMVRKGKERFVNIVD